MTLPPPSPPQVTPRSPDLDVRDGRVQGAGPVDQPLAPVDHSFLVQSDEGLLDGVGQFLDRRTRVRKTETL